MLENIWVKRNIDSCGMQIGWITFWCYGAVLCFLQGCIAKMLDDKEVLQSVCLSCNDKKRVLNNTFLFIYWSCLQQLQYVCIWPQILCNNIEFGSPHVVATFESTCFSSPRFLPFYHTTHGPFQPCPSVPLGQAYTPAIGVWVAMQGPIPVDCIEKFGQYGSWGVVTGGNGPPGPGVGTPMPPTGQ